MVVGLQCKHQPGQVLLTTPTSSLEHTMEDRVDHSPRRNAFKQRYHRSVDGYWPTSMQTTRAAALPVLSWSLLEAALSSLGPTGS